MEKVMPQFGSIDGRYFTWLAQNCLPTKVAILGACPTIFSRSLVVDYCYRLVRN